MVAVGGDGWGFDDGAHRTQGHLVGDHDRGAPAVVDQVFGDRGHIGAVEGAGERPGEHVVGVDHAVGVDHGLGDGEPAGELDQGVGDGEPDRVSASVMVTEAGVITAGCQAWLPSGLAGGVSTRVQTLPSGTWSVTIAGAAPAVVDQVFGRRGDVGAVQVTRERSGVDRGRVDDGVGVDHGLGDGEPAGELDQGVGDGEPDDVFGVR